MIKSEFNLSGQPDEKQISAQEDRERLQQIDKIKREDLKQKAKSMLAERDRLINEKRLKAKDEENQKVEKETQKKVAPKAELHIKPPMGAGSYTPRQREDFIRTRVRNNLGIKLDENINSLEKMENKKVDEFVDQTLSKQREKSKTTRQEFRENAESITQTTGRSRIRRR